MYATLTKLVAFLDMVGRVAAIILNASANFSVAVEDKAVTARQDKARAKLQAAVDALNQATEVLNAARSEFVKEADAIRAAHPNV